MRRLHNEELHNLYRSPNMVRVIWAGHVARMKEGRSAFKILTGRPTEKRPLGKPRCRWEDNLKWILRKIDNNIRNWIGSAQHRDYFTLENAALYLQVP